MRRDPLLVSTQRQSTLASSERQHHNGMVNDHGVRHLVIYCATLALGLPACINGFNGHDSDQPEKSGSADEQLPVFTARDFPLATVNFVDSMDPANSGGWYAICWILPLENRSGRTLDCDLAIGMPIQQHTGESIILSTAKSYIVEAVNQSRSVLQQRAGVDRACKSFHLRIEGKLKRKWRASLVTTCGA